MKHKNKEY